MSTIEQFLSILSDHQITLRAKGDRLIVKAPKGSVSAEIASQIRERKSELLTFFHQIATRHNPIEKAPPGTHNLSFAQQRLWFLGELAGTDHGSAAQYNLYAAIELNGRLNVAALAHATNRLARRHESLRTRFGKKDGEPFVIVDSESQIQFRIVDLSNFHHDMLATLVQAEKRFAFDLEHDCLSRVCLFRTKLNRHVLVLNLHHIITDGWSMDILVRDLMAFYSEFHTHQKVVLPALELSYSDYAHWQNQPQQTNALASGLSWWEEYLQDLPQLHELPTDRPRPAITTHRGCQHHHLVPMPVLEGLNQLASNWGASLYMVLLAAFDVLLSKYSQQKEVVVGAAVANRNRTDLEPIVGFFVNTLVLRAQVDPTQTFTAFLSQLKRDTLECFARQDVPFEKVVEALKPERRLNHTPLFQIMFSQQNAPFTALSFPGLQIAPYVIPAQTAKFDLSLDTLVSQEGLKTAWNYNSDLFDKDTIALMSKHYQHLLRQIATAAETPIAHLALMDRQETNRLLHHWHKQIPATNLPPSILNFFNTIVATYPDRIALKTDATNSAMTYQMLDRLANQWAHYLLSLGLTAETRVALYMERSPELIVAIMAVLKAGGVYVPIDPHYPADRVAFMIADCQAFLTLTTEHNHDGLTESNLAVVDLKHPPEAPTNPPLVPITSNQLAYLIYTSGSTGTPKAAANTHGGLANHALWQKSNFSRSCNNVIALKTPVSFDVSALEIFWALCSGATLAIVPAELHGDPFYLKRFISKHQISGIHFVGSMLKAFLDSLEPPVFHTSLKWLRTGGESVPPEAPKMVCQQLRNSEGFIELLCGYGPSETAITTAHYVSKPKAIAQTPPIGQPIPNVTGYIVDPTLQPVPIGVPGELCLGGICVGRGYFQKPALTARSFIPDPFSKTPGARLYRSGDLVKRLPNHHMMFINRLDGQVKLRGLRIELGEIEKRLSECSGIGQAVVLLQTRHEQTYLVAYVQLAPNLVLDDQLDRLKHHLGNYLPDYMVPTVFLAVEKWPQLPNGKIDKKALSQFSSEAFPTSSSNTYHAPKNQLESALVGIWESLLHCEPLSTQANFFESGGHSLLATKLISKIRTRLGVEIPLKQLFATPTIASLALWMETNQAGSQPITIELAPRSLENMPISSAQKRMWLLDKLRKADTPGYQIHAVLSIKGAIDTKALDQALTQLAQRHEILRTSFGETLGTPYQTIHPQPHLELIGKDLRNHPEALTDFISQCTHQPYDLTQPQLLRLWLAHTSVHCWTLVLSMHHIISDGWSMGIMVQELLVLYEACHHQRPPRLKPLPIQYADFAFWESHQQEIIAQKTAWWANNLEGAPALHGLPCDAPRPQKRDHLGAYHRFKSEETLQTQLQQLANQANTTLFIVLLAGFKAWLYRYSQQKDCVVGTPVANRERSEVEPLIGLFVNTLPVRTQIDPHLPFSKFLNQVTQHTLECLARQDVPFEKIVEAVQPDRQLNASPLFQIMFSMQNNAIPEIKVEGLAIKTVPTSQSTANFDLSVSAKAGPNGLEFIWEYAQALFEEATINRMAHHFLTMLKAIAQSPDTPLSKLTLMEADEHQRLIQRWNQTQTPLCQHQTVAHLVERLAKNHPHRLALVAELPNQALSYAALNQKANQLAWTLLKAGLAPEARIAVYLDRSPLVIVSLLAILKAGGVYVPLDPHYPQDRIAYMLSDCQPSWVLTDRDALQRFDYQVLRVDQITSYAPETHNPQKHLAPHQAAYLIYTSGSTGKPKAAVNTHRSLVNHALWQSTQFPLTSDDRIAVKTPFSFDVSLLEIFWGLGSGVPLILAAPGKHGDVVYLQQWLLCQYITGIHFVGSLLKALLLSLGPKTLNTKLRYLRHGGEAMPPEARAQMFEALRGQTGPLDIHNGYGPSEAAITTTNYSCQGSHHRETPPIGNPIHNAQAYVVDSQLQLQPPTVAGELVISGVPLGRGYLGKPGITAASFIPHPFQTTPGTRLYRTGDLVQRQTDGLLKFLGRMDGQVKLRGLRIEIGEIEAVLTNHPHVVTAMVVLPASGGEAQHLMAFYQSHHGQALNTDELNTYLGAYLPAFMVPSIFRLRTEWPYLPNGKINRKALEKQAEETEPSALQGAYQAPRTALERALAGIWQDVLKRKDLGISQNFFELGGHSLTATQVVAHIAHRLDKHLNLQQFFENPTVAQLASLLETGDQQQSPFYLNSSSEELTSAPLSFAQQRMWFLEQLALEKGRPGNAHNLTSALQIRGDFQPQALQQALNDLSQRHHLLRTQFEHQGGKPKQVVLPQSPIPLNQIGVEGWSEQNIQDMIHQHARDGFFLDRAPLIRSLLLQRGPSHFVLVIIMHHIISDGWSMGILVRELIALYREHADGQPANLAPLPIQYANFAQGQRSSAHQSQLAEQRSWWQSQLADAPPSHQIPTDFPRPKTLSSQGETHYQIIEVDLAAKVRHLATQAQATPFVTLLAAFKLLLYRYSQQTDWVIGTPIANRNHPDVEPLIGLFVNTLALRSHLNPQASFLEFLATVKFSTLTSFGKRQVPFEQVVEAINPRRQINLTPVFQIMFSMQNTSLPEVHYPGLSLETFPTAQQTTKFDLSVTAIESSKGLELAWHFHTDLFQATTIATMARHFAYLLQTVTKDPDLAINQLSLLDRETQRALMRLGNQAQMPLPNTLQAHHFLEKHAATKPHQVAVVAPATNQRLSYGTLNSRANQLAWKLIESGLQPEDRVVLLMDRCSDYLVAVFAVLKAGGCFVPLNLSDPQERLWFMIENCQAQWLLLTEQAIQLPAQCRVFNLHHAQSYSTRKNNPKKAIQNLRLAYLIYTSGSTGKPKAAANSHRGLVNNARWQAHAFHLSEDHCIALKAPISFDVSCLEIFWAIASGAGLAIVAPGMEGDPFYLKSFLQRHRVTGLHFVGSMFHAFLLSLGKQELQTSLQWVRCGGEALPQAALKLAATKLRGPMGPIPIQQSYGPSETAITVTNYQNDAAGTALLLPIGLPIPNTQAFVCNATLQLAGLGQQGELLLGGVSLGRGYFGNPRLTAARFLPNPFCQQSGERLYRSGDLVRRLSSGDLHFISRIDHQVKMRGLRIELGELEAIISQHDAVNHQVVLLKTTPQGQHLIAYVETSVPAKNGLFEELRTILSQQLPPYMVPSAFVEIKQWPRLSNGKLNRQALQERQETLSHFNPPARVEPKTPKQKLLAQIWSDVLRKQVDHVGANFFDLGGHSLLAIQVIARIREAFGLEVPLSSMFTAPTIASFCDYLEQPSGLPALPAITPVPRNGQTFPLSHSQHRLWFIEQLTGNQSKSHYTINLALNIRGALDLYALEAAFNQLIGRHEVLRTRFHAVDGTPQQRILAWEEQGLSIVDYSRESEQQVTHFLKETSAKRFDLERDCLLRVSLLRRAPLHHVLLLNMHHLITDGASMRLLVRDWLAFYQYLKHGSVPTLPKLSIQFADYAAWQQHPDVQKRMLHHLDWWKTTLADLPPLHQCPTDRPRPAVLRPIGGNFARHLDVEIAQALEQLARQNQVTLYVLLLTTFKVLLFRYSQQEDTVVGTPVSHRHQKALEPLVGFFVNTVVLRTQVKGNQKFHHLLAQVQRHTLESFEHQDLPFEQVVDALKPTRQLNASPLFQIMFSMMNPNMDQLSADQLEIQPIEIERSLSKFDLCLNLSQSERGLNATWDFNADLFDQTTVKTMARHYENLLHAILEDATQAVGNLQLFSNQELRQLTSSRVTVPNQNRFQPAHHIIDQWCEQIPDAVALVFNHDTHHVSYGCFRKRVTAIVNHLDRQNLPTQARIALYLERSHHLVEGMQASLLLGASFVLIDPLLPPQRILTMLRDIAPDMVLSCSHLHQHLKECPTLFLDQLSDFETPVGNVCNPCFGQQTAYYVFTSGSTGTPKASANTHFGLANLIAWQQQTLPLQPHDRIAFKGAVSFDVSIFEVFWALGAGATLVIAGEGKHADPYFLRHWFLRSQINAVHFVSSMLKVFIESLDTQCLKTAIRHLFTGGEALSAELSPLVYRFLHGPNGPLAIMNAYGPSEAAVLVTSHTFQPTPSEYQAPIGKATSQNETLVLDGRMQPVPFGTVGELFIAGHSLGSHYHRRPRLTAARFLPHPFATNVPGARLYRTGDLVSLARNGTLRFSSRADHQVKLNGLRIELGEIEAVLRRQATIQTAHVVLAKTDSGNQQLVAFVQASNSTEDLVTDTLKNACAQALPTYMVPSVFIGLEDWPRLSSGKIDRQKLQHQASKSIIQRAKKHYHAAKTRWEQELVAIWENVLGHAPIGTDDNFFEIGGHSLNATQICSRFRKHFGFELPLEKLFTHPTISQLGLWLGTHGQIAMLPVIQTDTQTTRAPLSFAQQRLWFLEQFNQDEAVTPGTYNINSFWDLQGPLHLAALEQAFQQLAQRHQILQTRFPSEKGVPFQEINADQSLILSVIDVENLSEDRQQILIDTQATKGFDLATDSLVRLTVLRQASHHHAMLLTLHHIIADGWSMGLVIKELMAFYRQACGLSQAPLPDLPFQYRDFARWQQSETVQHHLDGMLEWWQEQLADCPVLHQLPTDFPRPPVLSNRGASLHQTCSAEITTKLETLARSKNATLFMVLLAAFKLLLAKSSSTADIAIGVPIANRNHPGIERLIGFFVNTLVLRSKLDLERSFDALLDQVRLQTLESYARQDVPFEKLVDAMDLQRHLSHAPLFQIMFTMQNFGHPPVEMAPLKLQPLTKAQPLVKYELMLNAVVNPAGELVCMWQYSTDLFTQQRIKTLAKRFEQLLAELPSNLHRPLYNVALKDGNKPAMLELSSHVFAAGRVPICQQIEQLASIHPWTTAVVDEQGYFLSYQQLVFDYLHLASAMLRAGIRPGDRIALIMPRSKNWIVAMLASLKLGAAYVPIDPEYPQARIDHILADCQPKLIFSPSLPHHAACPVWDLDRLQQTGELAISFPSVTVNFPACLIYTSGSTGTPKASINTQQGLINHMLWLQHKYPLHEGDQFAFKTQVAFDVAGWEVLLPLMTGARVVIAPEGLERQPLAMLEWLCKTQITACYFVAGMLEALVEQLSHVLENTALRLLFTGGEKLSVQTHAQVLQKLVTAHRNLVFVNTYGPSEAAISCTAHTTSTKPSKREIPIGTAFANMQALVLNRFMKPVPSGAPGQLFLAGCQLSHGYLNRPSLTAQRFIPHPFSQIPGDRLYKTGDQVTIAANGVLTFLGRLDQQLKLRGVRIECGEIDSLLVQDSGVVRAQTLLIPSISKELVLVSCILANDFAPQELAAQLLTRLKQILPRFMVPTRILVLENWPTLASGKTNHSALRMQAQHTMGQLQAAQFQAARNPIESQIAAIWQEVLGLPQIGVYDNFFEIGGHSLLATQILSRMRQTFPEKLSLRYLFAEPTIAGIAEGISQIRKTLAGSDPMDREDHEDFEF